MKGRMGLAALAVAALVLALGPSPAAAKVKYRHTVGRAMGLMPARGQSGHFFDPAVSSQVPVVYHSGPVMGPGPVTVHTIFWAPAGYHFTGSPGVTRDAAPVALSIRHDGRRVFHARNVARPGGVHLRGLRHGIYTATWVISDRNGDTRTVVSRFEEQ